mmetsp:Transcript_98439/g.307117  ORF Transcript_98439/g.307117 Transcript_98439/m.307117 type:complete len:261 (+) Transcript_98439:20-802(+)
MFVLSAACRAACLWSPAPRRGGSGHEPRAALCRPRCCPFAALPRQARAHTAALCGAFESVLGRPAGDVAANTRAHGAMSRRAILGLAEASAELPGRVVAPLCRTGGGAARAAVQQGPCLRLFRGSARGAASGELLCHTAGIQARASVALRHLFASPLQGLVAPPGLAGGVDQAVAGRCIPAALLVAALAAEPAVAAAALRQAELAAGPLVAGRPRLGGGRGRGRGPQAQEGAAGTAPTHLTRGCGRCLPAAVALLSPKGS